MKTTKHTPGPWAVKGGDILIGPVSMHEGEFKEMKYAYQTVEGGSFSYEVELFRPVMEANARLIAAAPDMLEALRLVIRDYDKGGIHHISNEAAGAVRFSIARAEGKL